MIPIKLTVRNFMPYRDNVPPLSFEGIHTACISGENGSGKSSLIDAITWALWGRARAKSDDDLIYSNEREMAVEFDFAVEKQPYRIIRRRTRPKKPGAAGQTILEFQLATGSVFRPLTGNSIVQTQQKIIDVLHMDYETFINSAYLRQGHADEFTLKKATERKQVLADILGLKRYDMFEDQARERARQQEIEKTRLQSTVEQIAAELTPKPLYEVELERVQGELTSIEEIIDKHETRLSGLRQERDRLQTRGLQLEQLDQHIASAGRDLARWEDQLKQHCSRLNEYEALMAQRSAIEDGYARFIEARRLSEELDQKLALASRLNQRKYQLDMAIVQASQALLKEHALAENNIADLEASSKRLPHLQSELLQVQAELHRLTTVEETLRSRRQDSQELQAQVHQRESDSRRVEQEIKDIDEKLKLLLSGAEAKCPLCETELGADGLNLIEAKYAAERSSKSDSLRANQAELARKKEALKSLVAEVSRLEIRLNSERSAAQSKAGILHQAISEAEEAVARLNEARQGLAEIEQRMVKRDFAIVEQQALYRIETELARIGFDPQQHEQARQQLDSLRQYEDPGRQLEEADRLAGQEKEAASRAEAAIRELRQGLEEDNRKRQDLAAELVLLPQLVYTLSQAETEYQALSARQKQAQETMWNIKAKLEHCAELELKKVEAERLLKQASNEEGIYQDLAKAFGKKGIQALLIEMALPEIQDEANKLLARMTDNRMQVKIETQRESKKGDLLETLDINIADELGTRPYENYSGGEAFRINFAIRIALSRLLARRARAPLPILIIDEGFGTQDDTGIEKIKEAINSIQNDFEKILVITHIDELRDAFPNRIDVVKTNAGSTIEAS